MQKLNDLSRCLTPLQPDGTLIAVIEMSLSSWLVAGIVPGGERQPLKKLAVDENALLKLLHRWREEAEKAGRRIERIAVAFEAGRDGFWLARWLRARSIEAHVIHASSVAVSREHRRAKTDRLDTELLKRAFLGWLRGERDHCKMVAIPTINDEDAKRPNRERESLVGEQSRIVNRMKAALVRLGIRGFNPKLKRAAERLEDLHTPESEPIRTVRTSARELTWLDWPSARWRRRWHRRPTYRFCGRREARRRRRALSTHWIPLVIGVAAAIWLPSVAGARADGAIRGVDLPCWHHRNQRSHRTDRRDCCCAGCRRAAGRYQRPFSFVGCSGRARPSTRTRCGSAYNQNVQSPRQDCRGRWCVSTGLVEALCRHGREDVVGR